MIIPDLLSRVTAEAAVPEQLIHYVRAVAGSKPVMLGRCVGFLSDADLVLVGYPVGDPTDSAAMADAVDQALRLPGLARITVMGPALPPQAPDNLPVTEDFYYSLPLPPPPIGQKLRNLLRRAERDLVMDTGHVLEEDHADMVRRFLAQKPLEPGTRHILGKLPEYLSSSPSSLALSARLADGRLAAFVLGDFSALGMAFFMFCFRDPDLAPPGSADLLLSGLLAEAGRRGQSRMNLGLGINDGIRFFKGKWGATPFLPYVKVSWKPRTPGILSRFRAAIRR